MTATAPPCQEIDPWAQVRDYRHAITYAGTLPETDASRIGVWGSSYSGGHVPVVAENPLDPSALPTPDSWQWFTETGKTRAPNWKNEVTLRTVEMLGQYNPIDYIAQISPTPLLILPARNDVLTPTAFAIDASSGSASADQLERGDRALAGQRLSRHPHRSSQFAARMGAATIEVPSNHVAMVSHPQDVLALIQAAAQAVQAEAGPGPVTPRPVRNNDFY